VVKKIIMVQQLRLTINVQLWIR